MSTFEKRLSIVLLILASASGCAAVGRNSNVPVQVAVNPADADVEIAGKPIGKGSRTVTVPRDKSTQVYAQRQGYRPKSVPVEREIDTGWAVWDIATCVIPLTLCVPLFVDSITGSWNNIDPNLRIDLEPDRSAPSAVPATSAPAAAAPASAIPPSTAPPSPGAPPPPPNGAAPSAPPSPGVPPPPPPPPPVSGTIPPPPLPPPTVL